MKFYRKIDSMPKESKKRENIVEDFSHELKNPLAIIEGHLNLLDRWGKNDPEILDESIKASLNEVKRMKILVQEMLDQTKGERLDNDFTDSRVDVLELLNKTVSNFKMIYPKFTFNVETDVDKVNDLHISMKENHLDQLIKILVDNGVKYSVNKKMINVGVSLNDRNKVQISVEDFGVGIAKSNLTKVFDRTYRVDNKKSGSGLGLAMADRLVKDYEGKIWVESQLDQGTTFYIEFSSV